jgi:hypothetical protein
VQALWTTGTVLHYYNLHVFSGGEGRLVPGFKQPNKSVTLFITNFYILQTVHLRLILVGNQIKAQFLL